VINIDITPEINAIHREVTRHTIESGEVVTILLRRRYDAPVEDVWDAVADPERLKRWFLPVSGDLREGGDFQLEGNAGGRILRCDAPRLLRVTFGAEASVVELRFTPEGDSATSLELEHTSSIELATSGAGALYVGPGWDGAFMGLGLYLAGEVLDDPAAAANSMEVQEFSRESIDAWTATVKASGTAGPEEIAESVAVSIAQFAPDLLDKPDEKSPDR
jgi:uncharacterized protein YndB with AHSA1/START domain